MKEPAYQLSRRVNKMSSDMDEQKKSLGQHWLCDESTLKTIAKSAEITKSDTVLEIGPGPGSLTKLLVELAGQVTAVELDERLAALLKNRIKADNLAVVSEDILKFDLNKMKPGYKIVANIPYYLTNHLIRLISESSNPPSIAVLLVQKEVAQRVAAGQGSMSLLSVVAQYYWDVELGGVVSAVLFKPPPKVDSQVLILRRKLEADIDNSLDTTLFFRLVKAGFSQRRKTLLNSLSAGLNLTKEEISEPLGRLGIDPNRRAQSLNLNEWNELYKVFKPKL